MPETIRFCVTRKSPEGQNPVNFSHNLPGDSVLEQLLTARSVVRDYIAASVQMGFRRVLTRKHFQVEAIEPISSVQVKILPVLQISGGEVGLRLGNCFRQTVRQSLGELAYANR